jgi:hypothetical protein
MLAMSIPTFTTHEHRRFETDLGEKNLIFVQAPKALLEPTHAFHYSAPQQNV